MATKSLEPLISVEADQALHLRRFSAFSKRGFNNHTFRIIRHCRVDNGLILAFKHLEPYCRDSVPESMASFVPAAGASTRYVKALTELRDSANPTAKILAILRSKAWQLPKKDPLESTAAYLDRIARVPKALFPCIDIETCFLDMKCREAKGLGFKTHLFVSPKGQSREFLARARRNFHGSEVVRCYEQSAAMMTFRLLPSGEIVEDSGKALLVPAGHGALVGLFARITSDFPKLRSLFIRNIDNLIGTEARVVRASRSFLWFYEELRLCLEKIRGSIAQKDFAAAIDGARLLLGMLPQRPLGADELAFMSEISTDPCLELWRTLLLAFNTPVQILRDNYGLNALAKFFLRPLNVLGQVPCVTDDVGGIPVIAEIEGLSVGLCIEGGHIGVEHDDEKSKVSHFNPVFLVTELCEYSYPAEHPFWLFANKVWNNTAVFYHEALLYEMLGNSLYANVVFVEVPRFLFNPHKSLDDGARSNAVR